MRFCIIFTVLLALVLLTVFSGCSTKSSANCGSTTCHPPDVCCDNACYRPCPSGTVINERCTCVVVSSAVMTATPKNTPLTLTPTITPVGHIIPITSEPKTMVTPQAGAPKGLLVWYDFDEDFMTSQTIADMSGHGRDALLIGAAIPAAGINNSRAISFSGSGYAEAPDNPVADRTTVTFSFWFLTADPTHNYKFASAAVWKGGPGTGWTMATHRPEFWADDGQDDLLVPGQPNTDNGFLPGEWTHEAVVYDGKTMKEYTNGTLINTWQARGVPMSKGVAMAIGGWPQFSGYNFVGKLDDFRIYDYALSADEIRNIYRDGMT